jgi:hypothetical protein
MGLPRITDLRDKAQRCMFSVTLLLHLRKERTFGRAGSSRLTIPDNDAPRRHLVGSAQVMKIVVFTAALGLMSCRPAPSPAPEPARCPPGVPPTAQHPIAIRISSLAGDYDLIQVQTQPVSGTATTGRLHLAPLDSSARAEAVGGPVRDLAGQLEVERNKGRESVPAVLAGQHLRLGHPGYDAGAVQNLTITAVAPEGFWGWWRLDRGLALAIEPDTGRLPPDPAGYFCALRRDARR